MNKAIPSHVLSIIIISLLLIYSTQVCAQFEYSVNASVNLEGSDEMTSDSANGTLSAIYIGDCSSGFGTVEKTTKIDINSNSQNCPATHIGAASAGWENRNCKILGNNGETVPLNFNFNFTGKIKLSTSPYIDGLCFNSIANGAMNYNIFLINGGFTEYQGSITIQQKAGVEVFYDNDDFLSEEISVSVIPTIVNDDSIIEISNEFTTLFNLYNNLSSEEKESDTLNVGSIFWDMLLNNVSEDFWVMHKDTLDYFRENVENLMYFTDFDSTILEVASGTELTLGFDIEYIFTGIPTITTNAGDNDIFIKMSAGVSSRNVPVCQTYSNSNFSMELASITLPDDYGNANINFDSLRFQLADGVEIPITSNIITNVFGNTINSNDIALYPNPSSSFVTLDLPKELKIEELRVFNASGQIVDQVKIDQYVKSYTYNFPSKLKGQYFYLSIITEDKNIIKKVIMF